VVSFPDVPEAHTQGNAMEEATRMAEEALESALTFCTEEWKDLPVASAPKRGMRMIRVPALSEAKFKFYSTLRAAGITRKLTSPGWMYNLNVYTWKEPLPCPE
jgi:antitoxin HicB